MIADLVHAPAYRNFGDHDKVDQSSATVSTRLWLVCVAEYGVTVIVGRRCDGRLTGCVSDLPRQEVGRGEGADVGMAGEVDAGAAARPERVRRPAQVSDPRQVAEIGRAHV